MHVLLRGGAEITATNFNEIAWTCIHCFGGSPGLLATHFHEMKTDEMVLFSFHGKLYVLVWGGAGGTHFLRMEMEGGPRLLS